MSQLLILYPDGIPIVNGVLDLRGTTPGSGPPPVIPPVTPPGNTVPPGAIDISNLLGQKQFRSGVDFPGFDFHFVAFGLKMSTRPTDHLGWCKVAPQVGGDMMPGDFEMTGSNHDERLKSIGNAALSALFSVGEDRYGYPMFPVGGTMHIIGTGLTQPSIVDIRMVTYG